MKVSEIVNWFKSNTIKYFHLDEKKSINHNTYRSYFNFDNIITIRRDNKSQWYKCINFHTDSRIKPNLKVQENSNQFFRTHSYDINQIIEKGFGKNSLYSLIKKLGDYRYELPKLQPPLIENIALGREHLESGYKELNSLRIKSEEQVNTLIKDSENCKSEIKKNKRTC